MNNIAKEYLDTVIKRVVYYKELADKTFAQLGEDDFHYQPDAGSNSIAVIMQHLAGNMLSRWTNFLTEDGEKQWRQRDEEFEKQDFDKKKLLKLWEDGWNCYVHAMEILTESDLLKTVYIRQEALTVMDAINRQLAHYPYHIGQIVYIGRMIRGEAWKNLSIPKRAKNKGE